ncbi:DUF2514 domain-containing protein [Bordetella genomosp. 4]|uniref:DUF2514 domain-containing protein n=1 Tax=Bordetella genomosp. 4 TaxID=463044 RepID=A0A261U436_9BORD|nr:DUF2514 domain-containing protein [Bordetella genomosp. 4]OZI56728.1 hypothetical protein CAL20_15110 [Bordetella genomosp. 4]
MIEKAIKALAGWKGYAAVAVVAAILVGPCAWVIQGWRYEARIANIEAAHAQTMNDQAQATVAAVEAARTEERRRTAAVEKARDEAQEKARVAAADADRVHTELGRLRKHANTLARAAVARDPVAADGGPAGTNAVDLLAYMLSRVSDRAAELAKVADRARIAGMMCERAYDAVR